MATVFSDFSYHDNLRTERQQEREELDELLQRTMRDQSVNESRLSYLLDKVSVADACPPSSSVAAPLPSVSVSDQNDDYALAIQLQREEEEQANERRRSINNASNTVSTEPGRRLSGSVPSNHNSTRRRSSSQNKDSGGCILS